MRHNLYAMPLLAALLATPAQAELPEPVQAMIDAAIESGDLDDADEVHARRQRAHTQFRLRLYDEARAGFAALGDDPEDRFWFARSTARVGRVPEAMRIFQELGDEAPDEWASRSLFLLGRLQEDRDQLEAAMHSFERVAAYTAYPERAREALDRAFALDELPAAHDYMRSDAQFGKIILVNEGASEGGG